MMPPMRGGIDFLAGRRWVGVGLALAAEVALLVALAIAPPSAVIGIPATVAAGIGGTVAVVFGVADGIAVALVGALAFGSLGGWGPGYLAGLVVWPSVVAGVGLFARRVERHRVALRQVVAAQEAERRALALILHDQSAQSLAGALMALRAAGPSRGEDETAEAERARDLINDTIKELRQLAVDLSPRALEDYGLTAALARLAEMVSARSGIQVAFRASWEGRLAPESEQAMFRFVQDALREAVERDARSLDVALDRGHDTIDVIVTIHGSRDSNAAIARPFRERLRLLGGRVSTRADSAGGVVLRARVPDTAPAAAAHGVYELPSS